MLTTSEKFELFWKDFNSKGHYHHPLTKRLVRDLWLAVRMYDLGEKRNFDLSRNQKP